MISVFTDDSQRWMHSDLPQVFRQTKSSLGKFVLAAYSNGVPGDGLIRVVYATKVDAINDGWTIKQDDALNYLYFV